MSIQSTRNITRGEAIQRIKLIHEVVMNKDYEYLSDVSYETEYDLQEFVDAFIFFPISNIEKWTVLMLEQKIDSPFFRESLYDNYYVSK